MSILWILTPFNVGSINRGVGGPTPSILSFLLGLAAGAFIARTIKTGLCILKLTFT
jgi:hypothetical protein